MTIDPMVLATAAGIVIAALAAAAVKIIAQLQTIHKLVNSTASDSAAKLARLETTIASLQSQRVQDAQAATIQAVERQLPPVVTPTAPPGPVTLTISEQTVEHQVVDKQSILKK